MDRQTLNNYAGGMAIVVILLLLWWRSGSVRTVNIHDAPVTTINVASPGDISYVIPPLVIPSIGGQPWDWMQTTDLACDCGQSSWVQPMEQAPSTGLPQSYPVYKYVLDSAYSPSPPVNMPVYVAAPLPTWWYGITTGQIQSDGAVRNYPVSDAQIIVTSTGKKFAVRSDQKFGPSINPVGDTTIAGDNFYANGVRYIHDATKDINGRAFLHLGASYG